MSGTPTRRTQARIAERQRLHSQEGRKERLKYLIPIIAGAILVAFGIGYFIFPAVANPSPTVNGANGPQLKVDTDKIDLGDQPLGKTVHASFDVKNTGDGPLTLNAAQIATVLKGC